MATPISLNAEIVHQLDLSPAKAAIDPWLSDPAALLAGAFQFEIDYPRAPEDPRELSEIPELRLWFLRLDACYPWLPIALDWTTDLARYTAMLVPHEFHRVEGIRYNPEALEIFLMGKIFAIADWCGERGLPCRAKLKNMAEMLQYEIEEGFFQFLDGG